MDLSLPMRRYRQRLVVRRGGEFVAVPAAEAAYFYSDDKLTFLVARDGQRFLVDAPLADLESTLDPQDFFRLNRQYLARAACIACFRPIGKGKLGKRYEFGYVFQLAELTPNTRRGARGLILPAASQIGSPNESELLPATIAELDRLGLRPREVALDGGFPVEAANRAFPDAQVFVAGRQHPPSRRSKKRLASYRAGAEGRISHLKRRYGMRRSRLKGYDGARAWTGWGILTYNLDTLTVQTS